VINKDEHTCAKPGRMLVGRGKQGRIEARASKMRCSTRCPVRGATSTMGCCRIPVSGQKS